MQLKSKALAGVLAFCLGPLGMLYSTPTGAMVMFIADILAVIACFFVVGFLIFPILWIIQVWWAIAAVEENNRFIIANYRSYR